MSKSNKILAGFCLVVLAALGANHARAGGYIGVTGGIINTDITDHFGTNLVGGYSFNEFIGIEGRYLLSSNDDAYQGASVEIESLYSIFIVGSVPVSNDISVTVSYGHSEAEAKAYYRGYSATADESSTSLGFGLKYQVIEAWAVTAEYMRYFEDTNGFSIGAQLSF